MAKTGTGKFEPVLAELRDRIARGDLGPGEWLPSESALMDAHDVSRYSAREAIKRLASEGLIVVVDGKGSYVRARTERARHDDPRGLRTSATSSTNGAGTEAETATGVVVRDSEFGDWADAEPPSTYRSNAGPDVALTMGIPEHTPLLGVDRLLTAGPPLQTRRMLHRLLIPLATLVRVPAAAEHPFGTPDQLYAALHGAGLSFTVVEHVRATSPAPDDVTSLRLSSGVPVLVTRRVVFDPNGVALAMEETRRSAADTQFSYTIAPSSAPTLPDLTGLTEMPISE